MNSHDQALYELMSERYDGLQATCDTLRASLGRVERRNEELDLALEVAQRGRVAELGAQNAGRLCTQCAMAASFMAGGGGDGGVA